MPDAVDQFGQVLDVHVRRQLLRQVGKLVGRHLVKRGVPWRQIENGFHGPRNWIWRDGCRLHLVLVLPSTSTTTCKHRKHPHHRRFCHDKRRLHDSHVYIRRHLPGYRCRADYCGCSGCGRWRGRSLVRGRRRRRGGRLRQLQRRNRAGIHCDCRRWRPGKCELVLQRLRQCCSVWWICFDPCWCRWWAKRWLRYKR